MAKYLHNAIQFLFMDMQVAGVEMRHLYAINKPTWVHQKYVYRVPNGNHLTISSL